MKYLNLFLCLIVAIFIFNIFSPILMVLGKLIMIIVLGFGINFLLKKIGEKFDIKWLK